MAVSTKILNDLDKQTFAKRAKAVYNHRYRKRLEATEWGKVIAIEVESGEVFIGRTALEAGLKAREKYPDKFFYFIRIGYPAVHCLKSPGKP